MRTSNSFVIGLNNLGKGAIAMKTTVLATIFAIITLNLACDPSETLVKPGSAGGSTGSTATFCNPDVINGTCHTLNGAIGNNTCNGFGTAWTCVQTGCVPGSSTGVCTTPSGQPGIATCDANGENFVCNANPTGGTTGTGGNTSAGGTTASSSSPNATCDAAHVNQLLPGTTNIVCLQQPNGGYGWTLVNTGGTTAPATSAAGGNTAVSTSTSVSGNGICDANHINQTFNGMVCVKDTIDVYKWVLINTGGNGGSVPTGGTVATGGTTASTGSTSTGPHYDVCWYEKATLVCSSRWVPGQPTYADLMVWESPQGTLILTTAISSDGNYRWSLAGYLIGYYRVWYTCAGCGTLPSSGANYGANASNVAQISSDSMKWLGCPSPGYDIEFNMKLDGTLVPAGCSTK